MVEVYMLISTTSQPSGVEVAVREVMLLLSNVVDPISPGIETRMLFEGTAKSLVSSRLHDATMVIAARATIAQIWKSVLFILYILLLLV
jgi:hypothetical protein